MKKLKAKTEVLRRNGPVMKVPGVSSESGRESMVGTEVGLEPGVKERGSYG